MWTSHTVPTRLTVQRTGQAAEHSGKPALRSASCCTRRRTDKLAVQLSEMEWISHTWPLLNRPDPTGVRRYLPQSHYSQVPPQSPQRSYYSQDFYSMTHQSKKKRTEDDSVSADAGSKPLQLQRRRVWRACESCRFVPHRFGFTRLQHVPWLNR